MAGLPLLAALWLNSKAIEGKLAQAASDSLSTAKADWAKVTVNGRDARIEGDAPGRIAIDEAARAVAGTPGVRRVDAAQAKVVLAAPTADSLVTNNNRPEIKGTWPEIYAKTLSVILPERSYVLGKDSEVKSDGAGHWSFTPAEPLKDGAYDIAVEVDDGAGATSKTATPGKVTIDTVAPSLPVLMSFTSAPPQSLSGSWPEGDASALKLGFAGKTYVLGQNPALTSASSIWTLNLAEPLADGAYDLTVEAADLAGNTARLDVPGAVTVSSKPPAPTVARYTGNDSTPLISGTWSEQQGSKLQVAVGGHTYELGHDADLTSNGQGDWRLDIKSPLKDGIYDAVVMVTDGDGTVTWDETMGEIEIDARAPAAPVVNKAADLPVTGIFAPADTKILRVTLAGHSYTLGQDPALTANGEAWSLTPPDKLAPGSYDVIVEAVDAFGNVSADASKDELVIAGDAPAPTQTASEIAAPTVTAQDSTAARPTITGSWAEGAAKSLKVTLDHVSYSLGANKELTSSSGQWTLKLPSPLKDGIYDVAVETVDAAGKVITDTTKDELTIQAVAPATPTPSTTISPPAADCATGLSQTLRDRPLHFERDKSAMTPEAAAIIKDLAAIAATCPTEKLEVGGHTDNIGSESYNQSLSERRAVAVAHALGEAGVDANRLSALGYGETVPIADNGTDEGRARNRRIEIKIVK